ncbi:MAG: hypothetical protein LUQ50_04275 [Methanospirillum sp.]|uniref:hypothetical protein n=1 Tax=Methanospirillum sp. TaxID=45200 RepID=UPI00236A4C46|nr:hypothetical protein [Methanospirillum sp.]MDD1728273.1 hypothetical protein [Methanospirillum sp.]
MSEFFGIAFSLFGIIAMIMFMVIMMGVCFLMMRVFRRRMGGMNGCCGCMGMVCERKEEYKS